MRDHRVFSVGLAMLLLSGFFAGLAIAENDSLHVVMAVGDRHYSAGDTITIEVRVYDKGILTEPSNITISMGQHNLNNPLILNYTNDETGIYSATYTVRANDNDHNLLFIYDVWVGTDHEIIDQNDAMVIDVYSIQDTVDVSFNGQKMANARPGDIVTATILVRTGETPIPVTGFDYLYVEDQDGTQQNLTYREETPGVPGIYLADFTMPEEVQSQAYEIYADPAGVTIHWEHRERARATIQVNVLDVWYHRLISGTTTTFEICVADLEGQPVSGASFVITSNHHDVYTGTTNASGMSLVSATDVDNTLRFNGYVLANGLNQTIEGAINNNVADEPHHSEFDIIWEGSQTMFEAGQDIIIPYGVYDSTAPAGNRTIYYYIEAIGTDFALLSDGYEDHVDGTREIVSSGVISTTNLGKLNLEFEAPDDQFAIEIRFEVPLDPADFPPEDTSDSDGMFYQVWPEHYYDNGFVFYAYEGDLDGDGDVKISDGTFSPGEAGTITVTMETGNGDQVIAFWGIGEGNLEQTDAYDPEWMSWVPAGNMLMLQTNEDDKLEGDFHVPAFIEDQDVTVVVGFMDSDGVPHFDSKTISPGGLSYNMWLIIIIILVVVIAIIAVVVKVKYF